MKIAIEGCAHGELNKIYESILYIQHRENIKVDLLICCGDFQAVRDKHDLNSMAVPPRYRELKDFPDYYNGIKKAPILTLFIGGNHESANYLWELPYGGWVAENIYYLGYAGVVNYAGLKIGGLTGIFKLQDYGKSHFENPPFNENSKRSFYHVRSSDVAKLKLLSGLPFDIFLSHDWPKNIYNHGDAEQLMRFKPFLRDEIESGSLGSNAAEDLLNTLKPRYWFSAHMHAKFIALVAHTGGQVTKFLALDKCLPRRNFLQIVDFLETTEDFSLKYDPYWLFVLKSTSQDVCKRSFSTELPENLKPTEYDVEKFMENYPELSVVPFAKSNGGVNPQTEIFCERYSIQNPCVGKLNNSNSKVIQSTPIASRKFNLPTPKMNLPKPIRDDFDAVMKPDIISGSDASVKDDDDDNDGGGDEFGEITKPNLSSNPDEIDISDDDDDNSNSDSEHETKEKFDKTNHLNSSRKDSTLENSFSSFIETPARYRNVSATGSENSFTSLDTPNKKPKLIRRNQNLYTPSTDD